MLTWIHLLNFLCFLILFKRWKYTYNDIFIAFMGMVAIPLYGLASPRWFACSKSGPGFRTRDVGALCKMCTQCCQFLWVVNSRLPILCFLTVIVNNNSTSPQNYWTGEHLLPLIWRPSLYLYSQEMLEIIIYASKYT
jgi:hypothetical protein